MIQDQKGQNMMRLPISTGTYLLLFAALLSAYVCAQECPVETKSPPFISPIIMQNGKVLEPFDDMATEEVMGCCASDRERLLPQVIGKMPQMTTEQTLQVLDAAKQAWNGGSGTWPQMPLSERVTAVDNFLVELKKRREDIVKLLMWEIGKNYKDAASEFDRTVQFAEEVMDVVKSDQEFLSASWQSIGSTRAFVRRAAVGILLCLGPYNYPLNETYATLIPALLMGNIVILKIPTIGGLCHLLTMEAFSKALPPGTIHFVSGRGRATMPPLMASGDIDGLAFIGGSEAADDLIKQHPHPHRLTIFLQLEAKNMGIFLPDVFDPENESVFESALEETILGALSFNGQRCTALKLMFVPTAHASTFAQKIAERVDSLSVGLPWQTWDDGSYSNVTPLPNQNRVEYMLSLIKDATSKGAKILNKDGGSVIGGSDSTLMIPAVLYPVTPEMNVYTEEQFGPVIPIAPYDNIETVLKYGREGIYGQQVSIFTAQQNAGTAADLLDKFAPVFGKININSQCGRSPDTVPFSGRRSSAMGVMSVKDALREFSIPTVVAYKEKGPNSRIVDEIEKSSRFMEKL